MTSQTNLLAARLEFYITKVRYSETAVLQYHRGTDKLRSWYWPFKLESRVQPSELRDYRLSHQMLGPCCLCPMAEATQPDFVETAIYMASEGPCAGEYVASCARDRCGYFVVLNQIYDKTYIPMKEYPRRQFGERIPPRVTHVSEKEVFQRAVGQSRPLKRSYAMLDIGADDIPDLPAPVRNRSITHRPSVSELLRRLDLRVRPGITDSEFQKCFVKCECGLVTTRRTFGEHECIIDLSDG